MALADVAWVDLDTTSEPENYHLRINRINSAGVRVWGDSGIFVWSYGYQPPSVRPPMVVDGQGGCYILYGIGRLQRFRSDGRKYWQPQGVLIPTGVRIMRLDQGDIYLFGSRYIGYNGQQIFSIHLQKVDSSGIILWDSLGVNLDTLNTNLSLKFDFSTQAGYSTVSWPQNIGGVWNLRTQIVRSDGSTVFGYGGQPLRNIVSLKCMAGLINSDSATTVFVWTDNRTTPGIYSQRLDTLGLAQWDTNDIAICLISLGGLKLTTDANGGLILVGWRETDFTIRAQQVNKYGQLGQVITLIENISTQLPIEFLLYQNYPNPFNSVTVIKYELPKVSNVVLKIYDILGKEVAILVNGVQDAGYKEIVFDASQLPSGVYLYKLQAGAYTNIKKMVLMR